MPPLVSPWAGPAARGPIPQSMAPGGPWRGPLGGKSRVGALRVWPSPERASRLPHRCYQTAGRLGGYGRPLPAVGHQAATSTQAREGRKGIQTMTAALHRRRHRTLPLLLAFGLLLAWLPAAGAWGDAREISDDVCSPPYQSDFDDIAGSAHEDMIRCMADYNLAEGVGDGSSYAPRRDVTRGQMASFVARFLADYTGQPLPEGDADRFDDVPEDDRAYPHSTNIHSLAEIGVVEGTSASNGQSYAPQRGVTRAQMASMIRRALAWADDEIAGNDSAPPAGEQGAFTDTAGSVHEDNIDALADAGIVQGFGDDTYRPGNLVKRDQMASFVMRSYDYAVTEELGREDETENGDEDDDEQDDPEEPKPGPVAILSPTTESPAFPVSPGDEVDITFRTDRAGDYELEFRDPNPDPDNGFFLIPGDDDGPGDWTAFEGDDASGTVDEGDTFDVAVTLPDEEENEGVRDIRLSFVPADEPATTITNQRDAAIIVGDGVVINLTQERVDFEIQAAVDEADDNDALLAIGEFVETVEIDNDGLLLSGLGTEDTVLEGTIILEGVTGVTVSDLTITEYETVGDLAPLTGDEIGILVDGATDILLDRIHLEGSGSGTDDIGIETRDNVGVTVTRSVFTDNDRGVSVTGDGEDVVIGNGNVFEGNLHGIFVEEAGKLTTISNSSFVDNQRGVRVDGPDVTIEDSVFEGNGAGGVRLSEEGRFAVVVNNEFRESGGDHLRFTTDSYPSGHAGTLLEANTFTPDSEVVTSGSWTIIQPEEESEENDD
jgi:hypothetical protein